MRRIVLLLTLLYFTFNADAQSYLGFKGDFAVSSISSSHAKSRPGFSAGAIYSTPISEKWHFQPQLLFSLRGVKSSSSYKPDYSAYSYSLELPLILSYRMGDEEISFGVDMGGFARYGLSGNYWTDSAEGRIEPELFDYQKRFDAGLQLGFSVMVYRIYMGCAFQYGLIKPWDNLRGHNYSYSLSFGYLFEL